MGCKWMSIRVRFPLSMVMNCDCSSVVQVYRNPPILSGYSSVVELQVANLNVVSSNLITRSKINIDNILKCCIIHSINGFRIPTATIIHLTANQTRKNVYPVILT